jgi:chromosome segregation ATPase
MAIVPSASESTFLTSLNADRRKAISRQQKREELLDNMNDGGKILDLHSQLQSLADELDEKVEGKLNANENAFFLAYKQFMFSVQKEFKELKQKADEEETKNRRDAKIQSLEKELDWFMNEALRLDELCKKYKKELDKWKGKAEALEDDRQFLENQIKTAKKNNKSLRGAVEKAQTSAYSALVAADEGGRPPALPAPEETLPKVVPAIKDVEVSETGLSLELEQKYQHTVKRLREQLTVEQRTVGKLRSAADRAFTEPSEIEAYFAECVDQVKVGVTARKKAASAYHNAPKVRGRPSAELAIAEATIDDFAAADRRQLVDHLLDNEEVIELILGKMQRR